MFIIMNVSKAQQEFYNLVGCVVNTNIGQELDVEFEEADVEKVLLYFQMVKALVGMCWAASST